MSELKAINAHGVRKDDGAYYDRRQVDKYIDELDERHTTEITALEVSYRLQLDGLRYDKDAEIRRLKRALWLARLQSLRNFSVLAYFQTIRAKGKKSNMDPSEMAYRIDLARVKCLSKTEEYK